VLAKAQAGEMFEVSVGAWVWLENDKGIINGREYAQRWVAHVPDHLAVGLQSQGGVGACSIADGCGGMRVMSADAAAAQLPEEPVDLISAFVSV
jgi:hypothetical protein